MLTTKNDLDSRFRHHDSQGTQASRRDQIRRGCRDLATQILDKVPDSREQSLALTKLEEAMFWANAGISRGDRDWQRS